MWHHIAVFCFAQIKSILLCNSWLIYTQTLFLSCQHSSFMHRALWGILHSCDIDLSAICVIRFLALNLFYDTHSSPHRHQPQVNTAHWCGRCSSGLSVGPIVIISISHTLSSASPPPQVSSLFWSRRSSGGLSEFDSLHKHWLWLLSTTGKDSSIDKGLKHIQACWADSGLVEAVEGDRCAASLWYSVVLLIESVL